MQLGAVLPHHEIGDDAGAIRAYLEGVEGLGCTHLLVYDHVLGVDRDRPSGFEGPYDKHVAFHEPLTFLAFAAAVTRRIELVTSVLVLPQRQTALVAKQAAEVAILSGGRLRLGVGIGWNAAEYEALGQSFGTRGARLDDQVSVLRDLWTYDAVDTATAHHRIDHAGINPRPAAAPPIWFGGSSPKALERCARLGDGWIPLGGPNDATRSMLDEIRRHRAAAGRYTAPFGIQAQAQYAGGTPERWASHARRWEELGATHLAVATHNAGPTDVDGHLQRLQDYLTALRS